MIEAEKRTTERAQTPAELQAVLERLARQEQALDEQVEAVLAALRTETADGEPGAEQLSGRIEREIMTATAAAKRELHAMRERLRRQMEEHTAKTDACPSDQDEKSTGGDC